MRPNEADLVLHLLDDQLIDADGGRCGRVDDVELNGGVGETTSVAALLVGPAAWPARLPGRFGAAMRLCVPGAMHRVPWDAVEDVTTAVKLSRTAAELGLGANDGRNVQWVDEPAHGWLRLSSLLGLQVVGQDGRTLGRVRDLRAERMTPAPGGPVDEPWVITGLLPGKAGFLERLGVAKEERLERRADAQPPPNFIDWRRVTEIGSTLLRVSG
jgi:sporulation protein YlmC with PRC-barrel domain